MPADRSRFVSAMERMGGLVGRQDLAERWGVSRQRVAQLVAASDFPAPVAIVNGGEVWFADDCERWRSSRPGPGRPKTAP